MPTSAPGRLAIVLHSHMPYVEGFGTWPFGEEWLWEAMAMSYIPLLEVLGADVEAGDPRVTLSLTPVLCDQLDAPGTPERFLAFLRDVRRASHALDVDGCRASGRDDLADELARAAGDYERAAEAFTALGDGGILGALAPYAAWTSSATHAVLPLLATHAGVRLQLDTGIHSHRARFDDAVHGGHGWRGGFWLPECAYTPWLDPLLEEAGVHATCVDLTDVFGPGDPRHLRPVRTAAGPLLVPVDRVTMELVWSDDGYPSHGAYRDYHHRSTHDHHPWAVDGSVYDPARARERTRVDAEDFVARTKERVADGGLAVCALDTELLGHWWYEGVWWLEEVLAAATRQGLEIVHLDDALHDVVPAEPLGDEHLVTSWGTPRTLHTWDGPQVAELAWQARSAELRAVAAGADIDDRAVRELLALQSSDWAFMVTRDLAGDYPVERARAHRDGLDAALAAVGSTAADVRHLAPYATSAPLLEP
jgi:1,4-alpha-glucan branching enzyme